MKITAEELNTLSTVDEVAYGRGSVSVYGDGRQGKTALINAIKGKQFVDTESTVGIVDGMVVVALSKTKQGHWDEYQRPDKELEATLARELLSMRSSGKESPRNPEQLDQEPVALLSSLATSTTAVVGGTNDDSVHKVGSRAGGGADSANQQFFSSSSGVVSKLELDQEYLLKYCDEQIQTSIDKTFSLRDFGGN